MNNGKDGYVAANSLSPIVRYQVASISFVIVFRTAQSLSRSSLPCTKLTIALHLNTRCGIKETNSLH